MYIVRSCDLIGHHGLHFSFFLSKAFFTFCSFLLGLYRKELLGRMHLRTTVYPFRVPDAQHRRLLIEMQCLGGYRYSRGQPSPGVPHTRGGGWGAQGHTCRVDLPSPSSWGAHLERLGTAESHRFARAPRLPHCVLSAWAAQWDLSDASGVGAVGTSLVKFGAR